MTGTRTYSRLMYSQNRLNMNRIPYFLLRFAYSTCRVGADGPMRRGTAPSESSGVNRSTHHTHTHTHTHTERENNTHDTDTDTHDENNPNPQTNTPRRHLTTLEGGATTVRATSHARVGAKWSGNADVAPCSVTSVESTEGASEIWNFA